MTLLPAPSPRSAVPAMRIFVLSGQSNMVGRGGVHRRHWDGVVPPECAPDPSILRLSAALQWEEAREPLHADIDTTKTCGIGPGMAFARAVLPRLQEDTPGAGTRTGIGLVPCAVGGTAIREWSRGEHLYKQMVCRARVAAEYGEIEAVLWYQGESDAESDADTCAYLENVERLIGNVRADLGMPQLPFIQVALASGNKRNIEKVRNAQFSVNLPNVVTVDPMGMALNEDNLHLATESQVKLWQNACRSLHHELLNSNLFGEYKALNIFNPPLSIFDKVTQLQDCHVPKHLINQRHCTYPISGNTLKSLNSCIAFQTRFITFPSIL